ncbi:helix-turn-helix transcriptional regulator [Arthrobacter sp. MI7-26]|uniref:response regulator transcription factor n=1 Tax=Arthrobacter sp. MI7-26 TaxID=2993653 RepID=UPI002249446B|nr:helix-turn-helix transcriptional regulator [Arthrobacter sp. MI7-26]MCX2749230.1 helix-turn-helix transcriptional regulator [Arthrobacter sp. MI7-26]
MPEDASRSEAYSLTAREHEILQLLGRGLTGVATGHLLGIGPRTVAKHLEHTYAKLGCTNRIDPLRRLRAE